MFPYADVQSRLDLHHEHVNEMIKEAAVRRQARAAAGGRHRRFGRWPRAARKDRRADVSLAA